MSEATKPDNTEPKRYFSPFWVTFVDGKQGTCDGYDAVDALTRASEHAGKKATSADILPYPASPIIWQDRSGKYGPCPPFCYTPRECVGRTCCPKRKACDD